MTFTKKALTLAAAGLMFSSAAFAQPPSAEQRALNVRQAVFTLIAASNAPVGAMVRGRADFDMATAEKSMIRVNQLSMMISDAFAVDTRGADLDTESLDKIWDNMDNFNAKAEALTDASAAALAAIATGDEDAAKSALSGVGRTCGGCHDDYRLEK